VFYSTSYITICSVEPDFEPDAGEVRSMGFVLGIRMAHHGQVASRGENDSGGQKW
jgi:hypothetical protein